jgi:hypothetical protein
MVGTEHHDDARLVALPCTRVDTAQLDEVLSNPAIGGFETVNIAHDLPAAALRSAIAEFLDGCEEDELALLYISGHGARLVESGGEFFFIATDSDVDDLARSAVGAGFVNERLEGCLAPQKVAVLDCCHSGGFALGFRTVDGTAKFATSARAGVPLAARGVYVLSSSAVEQASFAGGGSADAPEPSVFTAAVVEALQTGAAGGSVGGDVTVDELFDAVSERLRDSGQRPVKSALHVEGRIRIASRPRGPVPPTATLSPRSQRRVVSPSVAPDPDWPALLGYFRDVVQAGMADFKLMPVSGGRFACLPGPERLLTADLDADGCIPVPTDTASLVTTAVEKRLDLWAGWPAVLLSEQRRRRFAPLLIRRVDVVTDDKGVARLQPDGTVQPHPGLARALLDEDGAEMLLSSYQPSWRAGERERLGFDAARLLEELDVPLVEELRPATLSEGLDGADPADGAVNVAVLFATETTHYDKSLLTDLDEIRGMPWSSITDTALAPLLDHGKPARKGPRTAVSPLPANAGQRAVLQAAMTRRLTVATGPPGTGKSQLIVDVVATAVVAGESVLVASTNNDAVDEVWRRCDELVQASVVRTGSRDNRTRERRSLEKLLTVPAPEGTPATLREAHRFAVAQLDHCRTTLRQVAERELSLIDARAQLRAAAGRLDVDPAWRPATDVSRAHSLARAPTWLFGEWRRNRLLRRAGLPGPHPDTAETCRAVSDFADAVAGWEQLCSAAARTPPDDVLTSDLEAAQIAGSVTSTNLLRAATHVAEQDGQNKIRELVKALQGSGKDWRQRVDALTHVRGWAVTCQSARRFPLSPKSFDLVVVDEASQCPIPHVVPLLFRARRALIVGDVMQLRHISGLSPRRDRELRNRHGVGSAWIDEHYQSVRRHSAFHAAQRAAGGSLLLDEHYRSHPEIAALANGLFYGGALIVLTEICGRPALTGRSIRWHDVPGRAIRGPNGESWCNPDEAAQAVACVEHLLAQLPLEATIGVVTPYAAQSADLKQRLGLDTDKPGDRVRVGTVHKFQGGERDVMVFTLVAGQNEPSHCFDWFDRQPQLWNVAITRARSNLIVVGDRELWGSRGGVGAKLAAACGAAPDEHEHDEALRTRFYSNLRRDDPAVQLDVVVNGHLADAQLSDGSAVLLDPGTPRGRDPVAHLEQMLRRRRLLAGPDARAARRIPAWTLNDNGD